MNFNCNIKVVDMIMGSGKTSAAINYINESDQEDEKILYITPFLSEIKRIKECCSNKKFEEPEVYGTKIEGIKYLIQKGKNIVSTHALFRRFDKEIIDMCRCQNYTLIMDEVARRRARCRPRRYTRQSGCPRRSRAARAPAPRRSTPRRRS